MKKALILCLAVLMALTALVGCNSTAKPETNEKTTGKVVINIEGTVTAVNGGELTLDSGRADSRIAPTVNFL